jgi:biofilm PGA synthesis protein PgaA
VKYLPVELTPLRVVRVMQMTRSPLVLFIFALGVLLSLILASNAYAEELPTLDATQLEEVRRARRNGNFLQALQQVQALRALHPQHPEVFREHLDTTRALGAFQVARDLASQHPVWLSDAQRSDIEQDALAVQLRHGKVAQDVLARNKRFDLTNSALTASESMIRNLQQAKASTLVLARTANDRIVGLRQKEAWQEAISLYESELKVQGLAAIPAYVKVAVADSYLATQRPAQTIALLLDALEGNSGPRVWDWRLTLCYAYLDDGLFEAANATLTALQEDVVRAKQQARDPMREQGASEWLARLDIVRINLERNSNRLANAGKLLQDKLGRTPFDLDLRLAQSGYLLNRAQPRAALAVARRAGVDHPESMWAPIAQAEAHLDMADIPGAKTTIAQLEQEHGPSRWTDRLREQLARRESGQLRIDTESQHLIGPAASHSAGSQYASRLTLETPLQEDHWRLVFQRMDRRAQVDGAQVYRQRHYAGLRYEGAAMEAELGASEPLSTPVVNPAPRWTGWQSTLLYSLTDHWRVGAKIKRNADDISARAQQAGVWMNTYVVQTQYRQHESRSFDLDLERADFSDGNRRHAVGLSWTERWHQGARDQFEIVAGLYSGRSKMSNVVYFSPRQAQSASIAFVYTNTLRHDQQTQWKQRFVVEPAVQLQSGYGARAGVSARYEHEWERYSRHGGRVAVQAVRRPYDGRQESRLTLALEYFWRFQ